MTDPTQDADLARRCERAMQKGSCHIDALLVLFSDEHLPHQTIAAVPRLVAERDALAHKVRALQHENAKLRTGYRTQIQSLANAVATRNRKLDKRTKRTTDLAKQRDVANAQRDALKAEVERLRADAKPSADVPTAEEVKAAVLKYGQAAGVDAVVSCASVNRGQPPRSEAREPALALFDLFRRAGVRFGEASDG